MYNHSTCWTSNTCALMTTILECVLTTVKKTFFLVNHLFTPWGNLKLKEKCTFPTGTQASGGGIMVMAWMLWRQHGMVWRWWEGAALCPVCSLPFSPLQWSVGNWKALRTLEPLYPAPSNPVCTYQRRKDTIRKTLLRLKVWIQMSSGFNWNDTEELLSITPLRLSCFMLF